jgi:hypothetical protein
MSRKQRNNKKRWFVYDCEDGKIWRVASFFRHPNAEESRVNNNRKRARIASIVKNRKTGGCSDKNYPFRRKTFRKEVAQMWRQTFSRRQIKILAKSGEIVYSGKKWDFTDNVKSC